MNNTILITGSTGFLGKSLAAQLQRAFTVMPLVNDLGLPWRLGDALNPSQLRGVSYIVHVAWDMNAEDWDEIIPLNIRGSRKLVKQAKANGVPVLFISSMSAFKGCRSKYGRAKLMVEKTVLNHGGRIIRPGLVWGQGNLGGVLGKIANVVRLLPVIGIPSTEKQKLHMTNDSNLGDVILDMLQGDLNINQHPVFAELEPISLKAIVQTVARKNQQSTLVFAINPKIFILMLMLVNRFLGKNKIKLDSLIGLLYAVEKPDFCGIYPKLNFMQDF